MKIIIIKNLEVINVFKIMLVDKDYVIDISNTPKKNGGFWTNSHAF